MIGMIKIACLGKLHAFNLAEEFARNNVLSKFYTTYASQNNTFVRKFVKRKDKEIIPHDSIKTNIILAAIQKTIKNDYLTSELFDYWVKSELIRDNDYSVFIGWSGMSLNALRFAKKKGKMVILERGSTHISYQNRILMEEYEIYNKKFEIDKRIIHKENLEYLEADYISVPSQFVKETFVNEGIKEEKIIVNPYGASLYFKKCDGLAPHKKFTILYLGVVSVRKGFRYFYDSVKHLNINRNQFEVLVIGKISNELHSEISVIQESNIHFLGHVDHYQLSRLISQCDVAVQPSIEEGLSMVILQILACGVPVIATYNTGAADLIVDNYNGFIVPVRNSIIIKQRIEDLYHNPNLLQKMKENAELSIKQGYSWHDYGERYLRFITHKI